MYPAALLLLSLTFGIIENRAEIIENTNKITDLILAKAAPPTRKPFDGRDPLQKTKEAITRRKLNQYRRQRKYKNIPTPDPGYQCRPQPLDVVFLMDGSKSVRTDHFRIIKEKIKETIPTLMPISPKDTQIAVIQFGSLIHTEFGLKASYKLNDIQRRISRIKHMQAGTMTGAAIKTMMRKTLRRKYGGRFGNPNVKSVGIIITDGRSQDRQAANYWAQQAKHNNITLYTIGIGKRVNKTELAFMASEPTYEHFFLASDFEAFKDVTIDLKPYICFDLDECEENQHNCEHTCVNTEGSYTCKCDYGYILHTDGKSCIKIDPCVNSPCDHSCHPVNGTLTGFLCSCNDGFVLQPDKTSCKPHTPSPPKDIKVDALDQVSLRINWTMSNLYDIESYQIRYHRSSFPEEETSVIVHDATTRSVLLVGLDSDTLYNISMTSNTRFTTSEPVHFTAQTAAYDFASWEIQTDHSSTTLGLSGGLKDSKFRNNLGYFLKYKPVIAPEEFLVEKSYPQGMKEIKLDNLIPGLKYLINVYEKIPMLDPASDTVKGYKIGQPRVVEIKTANHLHEFLVRAVKPDNIGIFWDQAPGNPLSYIVKSYNDYHGEGVFTTDNDDFMLKDLISGETYKVTLQPNYGFVLGEPYSKTIKTAVAPIKPIKMVEATDSSFRLEWDKVSGPVTKYKVSYTNGAGSKKEYEVFPPFTSHVISDLTPDTSYNFVLKAYFGENYNLERQSTPTVGKTEKFAPAVALEEQRDDSILVSWEPAPGPVTRYDVSYSADISDASDTIQVEPEFNSIQIPNLLPNTKYTVDISAQYGTQYQGTTIMHTKTLPSNQLTAHVLDIGSREIKLGWSRLPTKEVKGYAVEVQDMQEGGPFEVTLGRNMNQTTIDQLKPAGKYKFKFFAKIGKKGDRRYPLADIQARTRPLPPLNLQVFPMERSVRLTWTKPDDSYDEYKAICVPLLANHETKDLIDAGRKITVTTENEAICEDLIPAVEYKVGVMSKHDNQESVFVNYKVATRAPIPSNVLIDQIGPDSAKVSIGAPATGEVDSYLLKVTSMPEVEDFGDINSTPPKEQYEYILPATTPNTLITELTPGTKYSIDIFGK